MKHINTDNNKDSKVYEIYFLRYLPHQELVLLEATDETDARNKLTEILEEHGLPYEIGEVKESEYSTNDLQPKRPETLTVIDGDTGEESVYDITHEAPKKLQ